MSSRKNYDFILRAEAPSNIAFIKYWGKSDSQVNWPANDSLSMTLNNCKTVTEIGFLSEGSDLIFFEGKKLEPGDKRAAKIHLFLKELKKRSLPLYQAHLLAREESFKQEHQDILEFSRAYSSKKGRGAGPAKGFFDRPLVISTRNTFPTASGIASSASGFAALTIAALGAWTGATSLEGLVDRGFHAQTLANLARLGSGSACRSLSGGFVHWSRGEHPENQSISTISAAPNVNLCDLVMVFSSQAKSVSSRDAHLAAASSPLFAPRIAHIPERLAVIKKALAEGDMARLGELIEVEALEIHAISMTGAPPVAYLSSETLAFLSWLRYFRQQQEIQGFFTIDAGPNVHLICEKHWEKTWIQAINKSFPKVPIIVDGMGGGPSLSSC